MSASSAVGAPALTRGADGWRALLGAGFDRENVAQLATAIAAEIAHRSGQARVLVAHDGRNGSAGAAHGAAGAIAACGHAVHFAGLLPTPVATFAVRERGYDAAVLVTASHNPAEYNGVKLKVSPGLPPSRELEEAIEHRRGATTSGTAHYETIDGETLTAALIQRAFAFADVRGASGLRVVVDGVGGVAAGLIAGALRATGCRVDLIAAQPDPAFGGRVPDPVRPATRTLAADAVRDSRANIGFVLDGDGDRIWAIDATGQSVWPHDTLALLLALVDRLGVSPGAVAVTAAVGSVVGRVADRLHRELIETAIGFKHIAPLLADGRASFGGGSVGDIGIGAHGPDRDPTVAALLLLRLLVEDGPLDGQVRALHEREGVTVAGEVTLSTHTRSEELLEQAGQDALRRAGLRVTSASYVDGVKLRIDERAWLMLRAASTEPGVRVYAEFRTQEELEAVFFYLSAEIE